MQCDSSVAMLMNTINTYLRVMPTARIASVECVNAEHVCKGRRPYKMVTTLSPSFHPIFFTSLMQATRLHALLDPRNSPSLCTRYLDIATASSSVMLT